MTPRRRQPAKAFQLLEEIRQLRLEIMVVAGSKQRILDYAFQNLRAPDEPEVHVVFQPIVMWDMKMYLLDPNMRCGHAFGGPDPASSDPECLWCISKYECDKADEVAKFNTQVRHFLVGLQAQADEAAKSRATGVDSYEVDLTHELEGYLLQRAAQSWMLAHPPAPEFAGIMAPAGYAEFCPSRLIHIKCDNLNCFDCHAYVWLTFFREARAFFLEMAEPQAKLCRQPGLGTARFMDEPDAGLAKKGTTWFVWAGGRKRNLMRELLDWAKTHAPPDLEEVRARFRSGPGNDPDREKDKYHPYCIFHNCCDRYCTGLH